MDRAPRKATRNPAPLNRKGGGGKGGKKSGRGTAVPVVAANSKGAMHPLAVESHLNGGQTADHQLTVWRATPMVTPPRQSPPLPWDGESPVAFSVHSVPLVQTGTPDRALKPAVAAG